MTKFGLEVLAGKALSVRPEFIDEISKKVFCLECKLSFALLYLADMFTNKLKTRFNRPFFTEWFLIQKEFTSPFEEISPQELNKCRRFGHCEPIL